MMWRGAQEQGARLQGRSLQQDVSRLDSLNSHTLKLFPQDWRNIPSDILAPCCTTGFIDTDIAAMLQTRIIVGSSNAPFKDAAAQVRRVCIPKVLPCCKHTSLWARQTLCSRRFKDGASQVRVVVIAAIWMPVHVCMH